MKIEQIGIEKLIPYEFNNRKHDDCQVDRIANSIKEFGFNQPIVIDESNVVLVGHGRLFAAQKLGLEKVPVVKKLELSETQKKAYRILDNKLQNDSTWDFNNLELELGFLEDNGLDLSAWGLDDLRDLFPPDDTEIVEDGGAGALPTETYIKRGDILELGPHRVMCGDSTSDGDVSELLEGASPLLMVTDPPYGVDYEADWRLKAGLNKEHQTRAEGRVANDNNASWEDAYRLFPGGVAYVWHAGRHAGTVQANLEACDFNIRSQIIWAKPSLVISRGHYHWQHEPCWYAVKDDSTAEWSGDRKQSTLWEIPNMHRTQGDVDDGKTEHSTQKPIECMARGMRNHGKKGDGVYDPFLGSGTTLIAADQLGRICYGMEIEPKYCQVILERYQKHCQKSGKPFVCKINGESFTPTIKEHGQETGQASV